MDIHGYAIHPHDVSALSPRYTVTGCGEELLLEKDGKQYRLYRDPHRIYPSEDLYRTNGMEEDMIQTMVGPKKAAFESTLALHSRLIEVTTKARESGLKVSNEIEAFRGEDNLLYVISVYDGPSCRDLAEADDMDIALTMRHLASALAFLHEHGLVHGSIGPHSLSWAEEEEGFVPYLCRYETAFVPGASHDSIRSSESPYVAPECRKLDAVLEESVDVYALATLIHSLAVGQFPGETIHPKFDFFVGRSGTRMSDVLRAMLSPEPGKRPSARLVADILGGEADLNNAI